MSVFLATSKNGKLDLGSEYNQARFNQFLKDSEGKEIRIEKLEKKRTLNQNDLYWMYLGLIEKETGNNSNDLHEYFKRLLLPPRIAYINLKGKKGIRLPASTTKLSKSDFSDYMDKICALTNVPIPDTEEYKKYYESAPLQ